MDRMTEKELERWFKSQVYNPDHMKAVMVPEIRASWKEIAELKSENKKWKTLHEPAYRKNVRDLREANATLKAQVEELKNNATIPEDHRIQGHHEWGKS